MPRLVTKFKYLKSGKGGKSVGGYARYIATREGVERIDDSHRHAPATKKQQALIEKILRDFPETKRSHEYEDFQREQTVGNASEFISMAIEENMDAVANTKTYADYIATRPRAERFGSHGLFTDEGVEVQLSKVSQELNAYTGNVYTAILSLKREDAARLGFDNGSRWRDFLRGQTQTLAENLKIPMEHLRWYAAFHNEGHHPHVHLIAYSTVPGEGHLSKQGMENMRSAFAREIFSQELLFTYQQQTEYRDQLRQQGRESISDIVAEINAGTYRNPRIEELLIQLADRLSRTTGKKVYGYLKPDVKAIVDQIVAELAGDENIRRLYDLWYEQREDVLRTYTDTFPERIPLEQNKEFKSIRNAVIQEAMKITPYFRQWADSGQRLRTEEEQPFSESQSPRENGFAPPYPLHHQEETDDGDDDSAILEEQRLATTVEESKRINPVEPVYIPTVARSVSALMAQLARLFQEQDQQREQNQRQQIDRKQRREISEKKQAMGIRD
ncbi:MAG: MobP3 family relaxase [Candidatus Limivicinus sp.]